jgi:hypothetical protein
MFRRYCQVAAFVFAAYTAYPVVTKLIEDRLAHDWAHSALHLGSALVAGYAGWLGPPVVARLYVIGIGAIYGVLGVYGWFIPGLFLDSHFAIPLGPVENIFHLALAVPAVTIVAVDAVTTRRRSPQTSPA